MRFGPCPNGTGKSRWNTAHRTAAHVVVPNGVDLQRFQPVRRQTQERTAAVCRLVPPSAESACFRGAAGTILPEVWKAFPDLKLNVIAGPHFERAAVAARKRHLLAPDSRIRIQGFVEDVRPAYRECDIAVIPLPVSAGTNIKLMEAMACGRAVVSTAVGCQGLDLQDEADLMIREVGPEFAEAVVRLLRDENLRLRIASNARRTAELRFGWNGIAATALRSLRDAGGACRGNLVLRIALLRWPETCSLRFDAFAFGGLACHSVFTWWVLSS